MLELADIVRLHGATYRARAGERLLPSHARALRDIEALSHRATRRPSQTVRPVRHGGCTATTPAAIAPVRSVTARRPSAGWRKPARCSCRAATFYSPSRCRPSCARSPARIRRSSTVRSCAARPPHCTSSPGPALSRGADRGAGGAAYVDARPRLPPARASAGERRRLVGAQPTSGLPRDTRRICCRCARCRSSFAPRCAPHWRAPGCSHRPRTPCGIPIGWCIARTPAAATRCLSTWRATCSGSRSATAVWSASTTPR